MAFIYSEYLAAAQLIAELIILEFLFKCNAIFEGSARLTYNRHVFPCKDQISNKAKSILVESGRQLGCVKCFG